MHINNIIFLIMQGILMLLVIPLIALVLDIYWDILTKGECEYDFSALFFPQKIHKFIVKILKNKW